MSKFRGTTNKLLTVGLFLEPTLLRQRPLNTVLYSFRRASDIPPEWFGKVISARDTYIAYGDTVGYKWARDYLEDFEHFQKLLKCGWFTKELDAWNREIVARDRAEAIETIKTLSADESTPASVRVSASKYVAEEGWNKEVAGKRKAGRPSKAAVAAEVKRAAKKVSDAERDAERIGLKLKVVGGKEAS